MNRLVPVTWEVQQDGIIVAVIYFADKFVVLMAIREKAFPNMPEFDTLDEAYQAVLKQMGL